MKIKTKTNKQDPVKLKSFCIAKETIKKPKRQPSEWEKISANEAMDKGLISKIHQQHMELNIKTTAPSWSQFSSVMSHSLWPHGLQHARLPWPSPTPRTCSNSCPLSRWCHPTISSSTVPFSSCLQSFPTSASFPMSQFFSSGGQSIGASQLELLGAQWLRIHLLNHRFDPWSGKIPQATGQLSCAPKPSRCAPESTGHNHWVHMPTCPRAQTLQQEEPPKWEASVLELESSPRLLELEKAWLQIKTQHNQQ